MSNSSSRNVALRQAKRPASARRATEKDLLNRNDPPALGLSDVDFSAFIDAIRTIKKVDLNLLRRRLDGTVPCDLKNGQNGKDTSPRWADNVDWETKYMELKYKHDKLTKQIEENQELEDKLKNITAQLKTTEQTSLEQQKELVLLQQRVESGDKNLKVLSQKLNECKNELESKEKRLQTQQKTMQELQKAKDDALTRLSRQMGQQMSEGNPNIADLSDQNRPSKLGEIHSELYDNEWTDAFEVLTETFHLEDKSAIDLLLKIMWESSKHASDVTQSTMKTIEKLLSGSTEGVVPDCKRMLREARKHVDIKKADSLLQEFRERLASLVQRTYLREEKMAAYIKKCFQLCWLMSIQDPPVVLSRDPERGAPFDTNMYRHYTHSGDIIDYVIWPALLLNKDGPLLVKGVAEPYTKPRAKSAPAIGRPAVKDDFSFDKSSHIKYDGRERESISGSVRMDTTQYGNDARFSSKSKYSPTVTKTYPTLENKYRVHSATLTTPGQSPVSEQMQLYQHNVFKSRYDSERFEKFCQDLRNFRESSLRTIYDTDYDRYHMIYFNPNYYGHSTFT